MIPFQTLKTPAGEELVVLSRAEFDRLAALAAEAEEDAADVAAYDVAKAEMARGETELLTSEEVKAALDAPTPLAFWRAKRGLTQKQLSAAVGVSQSYVADLEAGRRKGDAALVKRLARALRLRMEDLVVDEARQ